MGVKRLEKIVERIHMLAPDIILLPGDFVAGRQFLHRPLEPEDIGPILAPLVLTAPTFAVLGNHDYAVSGLRIRRSLESVGIRTLFNEVATFQVGDEPLQIAGLDSLNTRRADPLKTFAQIDPTAPAILLSHFPDIFPEVPATCFLTVAGHTHGGQVRLPFYGPIVTMSQLPRHLAYGLHDMGGRHLLVSGGIGMSGLPIRFNMLPEIVLLEVRRL